MARLPPTVLLASEATAASERAGETRAGGGEAGRQDGAGTRRRHAAALVH